MKRTFLIAAATALVLTIASAPAIAGIVELGATTTPLLAPPPCASLNSCPTVTKCPPSNIAANCYDIILTQVTALTTVGDGIGYPTRATKAGQIVAFTVGLSRLFTSRTTTKQAIHTLDQAYGGTARVAIAVLKETGPRLLRHWIVVAESPIFHVQPFLGQVVQFPLNTSLQILPGEAVALTTPTWAPVLSINLSTRKFAYRQSRTTSCNKPPATNAAQLSPGDAANYQCFYPGTRVEYTATEVTDPVAMNPIHAPDEP
jgi:hypothetical protein